MNLFPFLAACAPTPVTENELHDSGTSSEVVTTHPPPGSPVLTVVNGFGGGPAASGALRHVWADVDPQATIVSEWTGAGETLSEPLSWNSSLVMPDHDLTVTAVREDVETVPEPRFYALAGGQRKVLVIEADSPAGLVLFFHGGAYSIDQLRTNAGLSLAKHLVRANYTVVALESEAEAAAGVGGWETSTGAGNTDISNVSGLIDALIADGTAPPGIKVFAWGKSAGGIFAHLVGSTGLVDGVVAFCASGSESVMATTSAPTAWYLAANDQTFPNAVVDAVADQAALTVRGIATDLYIHPPTQLYDQRFERVAGIDATTSAEIAAQIRDGHFVDAADQFLVAGTEVDLDLTGLSPAQVVAVNAEVEIMAADHELYDDVGARMVLFLDGLR